MKLVTYRQDRQQRIGAVRQDQIIDLSKVAPDMLSLIEAGWPALAQARELIEAGANPIALEAVTLLAPIPLPRRNVMCLGQNYREHAQEMAEIRQEERKPPTFFTKATHAVNGPYADIPFEASVSAQIDWEAELGVVVGRSGKSVPIAQALDYVFGYVALNDVSARDLQYQTSQYFIGKSLDGACPMGPWIVTADEIPNPQNLHITCRVNGVTKQDGYTRQMIYSVADIISILSHSMTLDAGDLIATGTPSGVGYARKPQEFLKPGDVVEVEIEKIGLLRNRVGAG
jgi:2-keto-4-pentenoate hydratase/2-oxohepta-3-ene-1,7-dioic acid hydratase in catechol pathway